MGLRASNGSNIMSAFAKGTSVTFPTPYIGLFKTMPDANMSGGDEVDYPEYARVQLNVKGIEGKDILTSPYYEDGEDADGNAIKVTKIKNQELIVWPENETGTAVKAIGWGLFESRTATTPYLTGLLAADATGSREITINPNSMPIVRIERLKIGIK